MLNCLPCSRLDYAGCNGVSAHCNVFIRGDVAVVKEVPDNAGMSITNAIDVIAATICSMYGIAPEVLQLYEYYIVERKGSLSRVYFDPPLECFRGPRWEKIDVQEFEERFFPLSYMGRENSYP